MLAVNTLSKGQVVLPASVRKKLGIEPGTRLAVTVRDNLVELRPLPKDPIRALYGCLKGPDGADIIREYQEEKRREIERDESYVRSRS